MKTWKQLKTKTQLLRRNGLVRKSMVSVMWLEESLWWERFVKEVGFKSGAKEWARYGWQESRINRGRCGRNRKRRVRDRETGMRLMGRTRELIPERRWNILKETIWRGLKFDQKRYGVYQRWSQAFNAGVPFRLVEVWALWTHCSVQ